MKVATLALPATGWETFQTASRALCAFGDDGERRLDAKSSARFGRRSAGWRDVLQATFYPAGEVEAVDAQFPPRAPASLPTPARLS
jgi:hypothetical protein